MILSSAILRFVALASLAVSATSNTIRGSPQDVQDAEAASLQRDLSEAVIANVGLGQMVCEENDDGSVTCVFRAIPPTDRNSATLLYDCMFSSRENFCLSTQLSLVPFQQVPNNGGEVVAVPNTPGVDVTPPGPPQPPLEPPQDTSLPPPPGPVVPVNPGLTTPSTPNLVPSNGLCPATRPLTGFGCGQYVSSGSERTVCLYPDDFRCTCSLQSSPVAWNCYKVFAPEQPLTSPPVATLPPAPTLPPTSGPLATPTPPPASPIATMPPFSTMPPGNTVTANINSISSVTAPPTAPPVTPGLVYQSGQILPIITNDPACPATIPLGEACSISINIKCTYYSGPPDAPTGARDCACLKSTKEFMCKRTSNLPGISF